MRFIRDWFILILGNLRLIIHVDRLQTIIVSATVNLAVQHMSPETKMGTESIQSLPPHSLTHKSCTQQLRAPVCQRRAMTINHFSLLSAEPHYSFYPSPILLQCLYRTKASEGHSIWMAAILAQEHKFTHAREWICVHMCPDGAIHTF